MPSTVLVLGATGRFGSAAARAFAAAGWQVFAQRRPRSAAPGGIENVRWIDAPAAQAADQCGLPVDVVVHAMNPAYTDAAWRAEAPGLLEIAIAAARRSGALLMFPGNVYNFGDRMPAVLSEQAPQLPTGAKGRVRAALECRLAQAAVSEGVRSVVIRAGDFFGSGMGSLLDRALARSLHKGRITLPGRLDVATPWAYLPDLAQTFVRVAQRRDLLSPAEVLHFAGHQASGRDWVHVLGGIAREAGWVEQGREPRVAGLPWPVLRAVGVVIPEWASLAEMRYVWQTPHALDNRRLLACIGAEPRTPFELAVRRALVDCGLLAATSPALSAA